MENGESEEWCMKAETLEVVVQIIHANSLLVRPQSSSLSPAIIPVTLQPSLFPYDQFQSVLKLQTEFNSLIDSVSRDYDFLFQTFEKLAKVDEFIQRLFHIYKIVMEKGYKERATLGLHRMDYMLDYSSDHLGIKQVELNTMAASLGPLAERLRTVHDYLTSRYSEDKPANSVLPDCPSTSSLCTGIATAYKAYNSIDSQVLFVLPEDEHNVYDQILLEIYLWKKCNIKVLRKSITQISDQGRLDNERRLFVNGVEIAVVYYRSCYKPEHFPTQKEWDARLMCELSVASNCPNLPYFLVGSKKVQQLLASPDVLRKYCKDEEVIKRMTKVFAGLYTLDLTPEGDESAKLAIENPDAFVMKPQREGGGNNIYGSQIRTLLTELGSSNKREEYILMERIRPPIIPGLILWNESNSNATRQPVINELGILGAYVRVGDDVQLNIPAGHIIKTKSPSTDEGGIVHGVAALDTPLLVPDSQYIQYLQKCNTSTSTSES